MSDLFNDLFDYNDDGKVVFIEAAAGMKIIDDIYKESTGETDSEDSDFNDYNDYDDINDDFDSSSDYGSDGDDTDFSYSAPTHSSYAPPAPTLTDSYGYDDERYTAENDNAPEVKSEKAPEQKVWTKDYYISRRAQETHNFLSSMWIFLILIIGAALSFWLGYVCYDGENPVGTFFCIVFIGGGSVLALWTLYSLISEISKYVSEIRALAHTFISRGEESQIKHFKKMRVVKRIAAILTTLAIITAIAVPLTLNYIRKDSEYCAAEQILWDGNYTDALHKLESLEDEDFKDTKSLIALCLAHISYNRNDFSEAMYNLSITDFRYQGRGRMEQIEEFREKVEKCYNNSLHFIPFRPETTTQATTAKKKSTTKFKVITRKSKTESDRYNAKDYSNSEDFYYDHYDDFADYYDAENYYNEHHD